MAVPEGLKQARAIGTTELLVEWLPSIIEDAEGFLASDELGSTYQSPFGPGFPSDEEARALLSDLEPWAPPANGNPGWQRVGDAMFDAAMDLARAIVHLATGAGEMPAKAAPFAGELAAPVATLKQAIADGEFDEAQLDELLE
jgi:hypothetical protein